MTSLKRPADDAERPAKKVKTSRLDPAINQSNEAENQEEIEAARASRKAEKLAKRQQRNERKKIEKELDEEMAQSMNQPAGQSILSTAEQPISAANLRVLLSLKNSTKSAQKPNKQNKSAPQSILPPVIHSTQPITATLPLEKGQRRKDPAERAAERAARKRARGDPEAQPEHPSNNQSNDQPADHSLQQTVKQTTASSISQTVPDNALTVADVIDQSATKEAEQTAKVSTASRPTWMTGAVFIESTVTTPVKEFFNPSFDQSTNKSFNQTLKTAGIEELFPIQSTVIQAITQSHPQHDVCVSSPTGSGKTLIYVLSVIQSIHQSINQATGRKLRALVLVPSRDLAIQVKSEFDVHATPLSLKCGLCIGQSSFVKEQRMLVKRSNTNSTDQSTDLFDDLLNIPLRTDAIETPSLNQSDNQSTHFESGVDILVCTPGRLIDHLRSTRGFTLQHLQFLVIDEVDRLLDEHFDAWTTVIHQSIRQANDQSYLNTPAMWDGSINQSSPRSTLQKLMFSATLTSDPSKLASLHLNDPLLFVQSQSKQKKFSLPNSLTSQFVLCETSEKPLALRAVLMTIKGLLNVSSKQSVSKSTKSNKQSIDQQTSEKPPKVLIFTSSLDSAHRLARLMELQGGVALSEYSSLMPAAARDTVLKSFRDGNLPVLICSDVISRGLDVTGVTHVINYDLPLSIETYVHRCGRTARAGEKGTAINIVARKEYTWFLSLVKRAANSFMNRLDVSQSAAPSETVAKAASQTAKPAEQASEESEKWSQAMLDQLSESLEKLRTVLKNERRGIQEKHEAINEDLLVSDSDDDSDDDEEEEEEEPVVAAPVQVSKFKVVGQTKKSEQAKGQTKKSTKPSKSS